VEEWPQKRLLYPYDTLYEIESIFWQSSTCSRCSLFTWKLDKTLKSLGIINALVGSSNSVTRFIVVRKGKKWKKDKKANKKNLTLFPFVGLLAS